MDANENTSSIVYFANKDFPQHFLLLIFILIFCEAITIFGRFFPSPHNKAEKPMDAKEFFLLF